MAAATDGVRSSSQVRRELREAKEQFRLQAQRRQATLLKRRARILEGVNDVNWVTAYSDMLDRFRTPDNRAFQVSTVNDRRYGRNYPMFQTEAELGLLRMQARILCNTNSYAIGLLEGLQSYVIGEGFQYRAQARQGQEPPDELIAAVQAIVDDFLERNDWHGGDAPGLEEELFWRSCEDGEFFLANYPDPSESCRTVVRTVEPEQVTFAGSPWTWEEGSFGVLTEKDDVQTVHAYWVFFGLNSADGQEFTADQLTHFKRNVKRSIKRGLTDFAFDTQDSFETGSKLRRNMGRGAAIQAAIAIIRQHVSANQTQVQSFTEALADYDQTNLVTGRDQQFQRYDPGSVLDIPESLEYVEPPGAANGPAHIEVLQAILRAAGVRWNAPEWLASADASNNNFASALVADSPFVKKVKARQRSYKKPFVKNVWKAVERYVRTKGRLRVPIKEQVGPSLPSAGPGQPPKPGLPRSFPSGQVPPGQIDRPAVSAMRVLEFTWEEIQRLVEINCEASSVETRDKHEENTANQIMNQSRVLSPQTWAQKEGLDYDLEQVNFEEHEARFGPMLPPLGLPGDNPFGGGGPFGMRRNGADDDRDGPDDERGGRLPPVRESRLLEGWHEQDLPNPHLDPEPGAGSYADKGKFPKLMRKQIDAINQRWAEEGKPPVEYTLRVLPLAAVSPTKFGKDYVDQRTMELVEHIGVWKASGRKMDYAPIVVDEWGKIMTGNHRHAARLIAGLQRIDVLVPVASKLAEDYRPVEPM